MDDNESSPTKLELNFDKLFSTLAEILEALKAKDSDRAKNQDGIKKHFRSLAKSNIFQSPSLRSYKQTELLLDSVESACLVSLQFAFPSIQINSDLGISFNLNRKLIP